jgi:hypothetical protein
MEINIIYGTHYFDRELFILEIDKKRTMVYRTSGNTGGRKGRILPFMFLNEEQSSDGLVIGHINKDFLYDGKIITHNKKIEKFPGLKEKLNLIEEKIKYEKNVALNEDISEITTIAKNINMHLKKIMGENTSEHYDFKLS